ncbi:MAG: hypothetical protein HYT09_02805 [Candidatus Levybacteria bacterium]|nr:hypothetical protein [Candidatus Levybacteria bacterium]
MLLDKVQKFIAKNGTNIKEDQYFLIDEDAINKLVEIADINDSDRVLEIGPGLGFLTKSLASKAESVIAIEKDEKFRETLSVLPKNVEVIFGDAYKLLNNQSFREKTSPPNKTVSNIPYSQAQNMLHNYTNHEWYQGDLIWVAPLSMVNKINNEPILGAYFHAELVEIVSKSSFYPEPNTTSAIIIFKRIPDPKLTKDFAIYFRRWLYSHEAWKVKNAIREGIIAAAFDLKNKKITKNQARELIERLNIPEQELEKLTNNISLNYYFDVPNKLREWLII